MARFKSENQIILYEAGLYFVYKRAGKGYEVVQFKPAGYCIVVATIGYEGPKGLEMAKREADRRANKDSWAELMS